MTAGEGACASAAWRSTAGVLAWPIKFPALRTGSSRAPKGANTRPLPGAEKGSVFAEERGSGRMPVRATRRDLLDEWAKCKAEESRM